MCHAVNHDFEAILTLFQLTRAHGADEKNLFTKTSPESRTFFVAQQLKFTCAMNKILMACVADMQALQNK